MSSAITSSAATRQNLLSLQDTAALAGTNGLRDLARPALARWGGAWRTYRTHR